MMGHRVTRTGAAAWLGRLWWGLCLAALSWSALAFTPPEFQGDVLDEVGLFSPEQQAALKQRIRELREHEGILAAIYVAGSLQDDSIEAAAVATFEQWKLGRKGRDNGVLVLLAPNQHKLRIEVGYGLEGAITDALSKRIIEDIYKPAFRDKRHADGLLAGFDAMVRAVRQEMPPEAAAPAAGGDAGDVDWGGFFGLWCAVLLGNLVLAALYWAIRRRRDKRRVRRGNGGSVRDAFAVFGFLGVVFGLFAAVFGSALAGDPEVLPGVLFANGIFDLVFFCALVFGGKSSRSGGSSDFSSRDSSDWSSSSSSSSWSSSSDSGSSSDGGSSGGGGASGDD